MDSRAVGGPREVALGIGRLMMVMRRNSSERHKPVAPAQPDPLAIGSGVEENSSVPACGRPPLVATEHYQSLRDPRIASGRW